MGAAVYAVDRVESPVPGVARSMIADLGDKESIDAAFCELPVRVDAFFGVAGVSGVHNSFAETVTINYIANKYITDSYLTERIAEGGSITFVTSNGGGNCRRYGRNSHPSRMPATGTTSSASRLGSTTSSAVISPGSAATSCPSVPSTSSWPSRPVPLPICARSASMRCCRR